MTSDQLQPPTIKQGLNVEKLPIAEKELTEFIQDQIRSQSEPGIKAIVEKVLKLLGEKSSKFKYIIHTTKLIVTESANNQVATTLNALWDEKTDGLFTIPVELNENEKYILTVIFVSV